MLLVLFSQTAFVVSSADLLAHGQTDRSFEVPYSVASNSNPELYFYGHSIAVRVAFTRRRGLGIMPLTSSFYTVGYGSLLELP